MADGFIETLTANQLNRLGEDEACLPSKLNMILKIKENVFNIKRMQIFLIKR